jgi:hypothetical protein
MLRPLAQQILAWLDDLLLHAPSVPNLLGFLRDFFLLCRQHNLKLHPGKCVLFATEVRWCGRMISSTGVRFDPRRAQGLLDMPAPTTGADLQQFVCALNWMRTSIPSFDTLIAPLQTLLESVYEAAGGKRTKTAAAKVQLHLASWTTHHAEVLAACKNSLLHEATLAHPSPDIRLCLYADASHDYWSSMATQVPPADLELLRATS